LGDELPLSASTRKSSPRLDDLSLVRFLLPLNQVHHDCKRRSSTMVQQNTLIMSKSETDVSLYLYGKPHGDELKVIEPWGVMMDECGREAFSFMAKRMEKNSEAFRQAAKQRVEPSTGL
jgi:hypothetical protein